MSRISEIDASVWLAAPDLHVVNRRLDTSAATIVG